MYIGTPWIWEMSISQTFDHFWPKLDIFGAPSLTFAVTLFEIDA